MYSVGLLDCPDSQWIGRIVLGSPEFVRAKIVEQYDVHLNQIAGIRCDPLRGRSSNYWRCMLNPISFLNLTLDITTRELETSKPPRGNWV